MGGENEEFGEMSQADFFKTQLDTSIQAVVVGLDTKFNYKKLAMANLAIQTGKAKFFACNEDAYDFIDGLKSPGAGAMVEAIFLSLNQVGRPTVIGKPNSFAWELIRQEHSVSLKALMLGDRLDTDILFGNRAGLATCLVLSGVVRFLDEADSKRNTELEPTFVI